MEVRVVPTYKTVVRISFKKKIKTFRTRLDSVQKSVMLPGGGGSHP